MIQLRARDQPRTEVSRICPQRRTDPSVPRLGTRIALARRVLFFGSMSVRRHAVSAAVVVVTAVFLLATGCGSAPESGTPGSDAGDANTTEVNYDVTFTCAPGGPECPPGQECPTVPRGGGGCEDLPGALGYMPTKLDVGHPIGCQVGLAYGNPYYGNTQVRCTCQIVVGTRPEWLCPI